MDSLLRELRFALRDKVVIWALLATALLSSYAIHNGLSESADEASTIERVQTLVTEDREYNIAKQKSAGGAAYYSFHFTYQPPSSLAFIARGTRDDLPWKHRLRMLALEGQIYETDSGNPELSRIGKLDFAFVIAFLLPLLSILLLYDLRAVEVRNNRWAFLSVTSGNGRYLLIMRAALRALLLLIAGVTPFIVTAILKAVALSDVLLVLLAISINVFFWCALALLIIKKIDSGPTAAALLLGCWLLICVVIPVTGKLFVEQSITVPSGGEILLLQRETVNDAWDLPKEDTMVPFIKQHPQWANTTKIQRPFEWKWYYAFQQVGDQRVETLSKKLRDGIRRRDKAMKALSYVSPSLLTQRALTRVAQTDIQAFQAYEQCVRDFHLSLREFHYPMLFGDVEFSLEKMKALPQFTACS